MNEEGEFIVGFLRGFVDGFLCGDTWLVFFAEEDSWRGLFIEKWLSWRRGRGGGMRSGMGLRGGCWGCVTDSRESNKVSLAATGRRFLMQMSDEKRF